MFGLTKAELVAEAVRLGLGSKAAMDAQIKSDLERKVAEARHGGDGRRK